MDTVSGWFHSSKDALGDDGTGCRKYVKQGDQDENERCDRCYIGCSPTPSYAE